MLSVHLSLIFLSSLFVSWGRRVEGFSLTLCQPLLSPLCWLVWCCHFATYIFCIQGAVCASRPFPSLFAFDLRKLLRYPAPCPALGCYSSRVKPHVFDRVPLPQRSEAHSPTPPGGALGPHNLPQTCKLFLRSAG